MGLAEGSRSDRDNKFKVGLHWCSKCREYLDISKFSKNKTGYYGLQMWCKKCSVSIRREQGYHKKRGRQLQSYYKQLFGGACTVCGYARTPHALDFHHINRGEKEHKPSRLILTNNDALIRYELDKCALVCKNCHIEVETGATNVKFTKNPNGVGWIAKNTLIDLSNCWTNVPDKILYSQMELFQ